MNVLTKIDGVGPSGEFDAIYELARKVFLAQSKLPRVIEAEQWLLSAVLEGRSELSHHDRLAILSRITPDANSPDNSLLVEFVQRLTAYPLWFNANDVDRLKCAGFSEVAILEVVLTAAIGELLLTLGKGMIPAPKLSSSLSGAGIQFQSPPLECLETFKPYLTLSPELPNDCSSYVRLREQFGFVPNLFRMQCGRPDVVEAEVRTLEAILIPDDPLSRVRKEQIMLAVSAFNLNTYGVALHTQVLSALGVPEEESDQIVTDCRLTPSPAVDSALTDSLRSLCGRETHREVRSPFEALHNSGLSELQIIEAVATCAFANFLNTVQTGVGAVPDFPPRRIFTPKDLYLSEDLTRPISEVDDPDATLVARSKSGDTAAFEELVRRHTKRVFGTLAGLLGNLDEVQDAVQEVFLKAFEHIEGFQGRSKFSTWLVSIAINTGTEMLRQRKTFESLDIGEDDDEFRPRQIQSWAESPEKLVSAEQMRTLVRQGVMRLPEIYRVAVLLRDINQLSTEEAAAALGLSVPALKARLLRGRLMLRESLTPYFSRSRQGSSNA